MSQSTPTEGLAVRLELDSSFASADPQRRREFPTQAIRPEPGECFARNLAALRRSQPAIAALVEQSDVPDSVTSTEGRDGSLTYVLPGENDRREWLGRSSMPSVSADALYGECSYEGTNVSLPGIMTGVELLVLAGRLPPQCAIFVVEADPLRLRLAMQLHDYSALIDSGRAVFLDARDLAAALRDFFTDHPGYDFPRTLFTGALRAPAKVAELQRRFESAGEAALQAQGAALVGVVERLGRQSYERIPIGCGTGFQPVRARVENPCHTAHSDTRLEGVPAVPRIALVSMDQRLDSLEQGRRLARGLSALGVANTVCLPETPGRCHVVAGLLAIEAIEADLVLSVNVGVERWRALLPEDLPIGAILLGAEAAAKSVIESLAPRDLVFAASIEVEQAALTNGLPPEQCRRFDPALDDALLRVGEGVRFDPATREFDVAIVADVPDDRAEANDVTLASHVSLWNAVLSVAKRYAQGARATRAGGAEALLGLAEKDCNVRIDGSDLRRFFEDATRNRIVPAAFARAALASLVDGRTRVALCGANWDATVRGTARIGDFPLFPDIPSLAKTDAVLVFPIPDRRSVQLALDAAAAGANVLMRAGDVPFRDEYPQLASVASLLPFYRNGDELRRAVRSLLGSAATDRSALREALAREHTVARRIQWMIDQLRHRQESAACGLS